MKRLLVLLTVLLFSVSLTLVKAQDSGNATTDVILKSYSAKMFIPTPVKDSDLDLILKCGIKAPSARNSQGWKFIVFNNTDQLRDIIQNITPGNVTIIVAGPDSQQPGINPDFDCALAIENMYVAAQSLGYGAHIYAGPVNAVNQKKDVYGIPEGYRAVGILRIGSIDKTVDATSSASTRKAYEEVVVFRP